MAYFAHFTKKKILKVIWSSHMLCPLYPCSILVGADITQILFYNEEFIPNIIKLYQSIPNYLFSTCVFRFKVSKIIIKVSTVWNRIDKFLKAEK